MLPVDPNQKAFGPDTNFLEALPDNVKTLVIEMLDPPDIERLGKCSRYWRDTSKDDVAWKPLARIVGCPLEGELSAKVQVKEFVHRLLEILKRKRWPKKALQIAVKPLTKERIIHIRDVITAHDIISFWSKLGAAFFDRIDQNEIFGEILDDFDAEQLIAKSSQFALWFEANKVELTALTHLNFQYSNLSHLPKQLYAFKGLQSLCLSNNDLRCIPPEICELTELRALNISSNPLTKFPRHIFKLPNLTKLFLTCEKLAPDSNDPLALPKGLLFHKSFLQGMPVQIDRQIRAALGYMDDSYNSTLDLLNAEVSYTRHSIEFAPANLVDLLSRYDPWLTFDQIQHVIQCRRARETLQIWKLLHREISPKEPFEIKDLFLTSEELLQKAAEFPKWLALHETELKALKAFQTIEWEPPIELCSPLWIGKLPCKTREEWSEAVCKELISYVGSPTPHLKPFYERLLQAIDARPSTPSDIKAILRQRHLYTCEQIRTMHQWIQATDTIQIWRKLCVQLNIDPTAIPAFSQDETSQAAIEAAAQFSAWVEEHEEQLAQLESLNLSDLQLFFLPTELGRLTGLKSLQLNHNRHLMTIPKSISDLPKLEKLELRNTPHEDLQITR